MAENIFKLFRAGMKGPIMPELFNAEPEGGLVTAEGISRPGLGRDRRGGDHPQRPGAVPTGATGPALCRGQGERVRARGRRGRPGGAGRRGHRAGGRPGRRGRRPAPARRAWSHPAPERVRPRRRRRRHGQQPHAHAVHGRGRRALLAGGASARTAQVGPRQAGHGHAPRRRADGRRRGDPAGRGRRSAAGVRGPVDAPGRGRRGERRRPRLHPGPAGVVRCRADRPRSRRMPCPTWCTRPTRRAPSSIPRRATAWCAAGSVSTAASPARR